MEKTGKDHFTLPFILKNPSLTKMLIKIKKPFPNQIKILGTLTNN